MTSTLFITRSKDPVGRIVLDEKRRWIFQYDPSWLSHQESFPISVRLPLQEAPFEPDQAKSFFANLLPEGEIRKLIAAKVGVSSANDFALLAAIGGECAGALSISPEETSLSKEGHYRALSEAELHQLIQERTRRPLLVADREARLSLAGAQDKVPVYYEAGKFSFPEGGAPSSHILKPLIPHVDDSVQNEAFCMNLAKEVGLEVPDSQILFIKEQPIYLVARYDRSGTPPEPILRLHQEDFCQATGKLPDEKYQNEGGPSFADCFNILEKFSSHPAVDKKSLIQWAVFNFLIGNADAHAKNISLRISSEGIRLAPFYDLMSTTIYEGLSDRMAMKIGGHYRREEIFERHWIKFANEAHVMPKIVLQILEEFSKKLLPIAEKLQKEWIRKYDGKATLEKINKTIRRSSAAILDGPTRNTQSQDA